MEKTDLSPAGVSDVAALTASLRTRGTLAGDASVVAVDVAPLGAGLLADTFRLVPTYDPPSTGPETIVAKVPSTDAEAARTAASIGAYERECRFYAELAPQLSTRTPTLFGTLGTDGLLLEDLSGIAAPGDQLDQASPEQLERARGELAGLQAPPWDNAEIGAHDWLHRRMGVPITELAARYRRSWEAVRDRLGPQLEPAERELVERFGAGCEQWAMTLPGPYTLAHHDYRLDNMMFSEDRVWVLDWQIIGWGAPMWDLAYLVGSSLDPPQRLALERETVDRHVEDLSARGVPGLTRDATWTEYRRLSLAILMVIVPAAGTVRSTPRGDRMLVQMIHKGATQALDLDAEEFLAG